MEIAKMLGNTREDSYPPKKIVSYVTGYDMMEQQLFLRAW